MQSVKYSNQQEHTDGLTCFSLYFMQVAIYTNNLATNFIFNSGFYSLLDTLGVISTLYHRDVEEHKRCLHALIWGAMHSEVVTPRTFVSVVATPHAFIVK